LEKDIENICDLNPFTDPNIAFLDNQINDFIDNYFENKNDHVKNNLLCLGCNDVKTNTDNKNDQNKAKETNGNGGVLNSLLDQLDELEVILQSTKQEIVKKMKKTYPNN
jgi:hypothetical protein